MGSRGDPAGPSRISSRYRRRCTLAREQRVEICDRTCSCRRRRVDSGCSLVAAVASMGSTKGALPIGHASGAGHALTCASADTLIRGTAILSVVLHITTASTTMTGYRCCAAMMVRAFPSSEAVSRRSEAFCVSFSNQFQHSRWLFRSKHGPTTSVSY